MEYTAEGGDVYQSVAEVDVQTEQPGALAIPNRGDEGR